MLRLRLTGAMLAPALLAGCATAVPPPAPVLGYARTDCAAAPDLAGAVSLVPEKPKAVWNVDRPIGTGPCLGSAGAASPYLVFALPASGTARMIEVGALLEGARIFSPSVVLLDAEGKQTRSFAPDQYMMRTGLYSVQFTPGDAERYALVTVDPARVGQSYDALVTGVSSTYVPLGAYGGTNWRAGHEAMTSRGFSYEGTVRVNLYAPPKE